MDDQQMAELFATSKQTISNCLIIISPISPFSNMLNTWWLCVILQYHSISHAFCRHTINGIPFHYLDVWYAVILISHYFSLGIRLLYKLWYCDNDFIKTMWKSVSLLHLPENHWCSKTCRWNRGFTSVSLIPLMSPPYSSVCKRCLIEEWLGPNHSAKAY